jgi:non-specific serine/threonine protein kinase
MDEPRTVEAPDQRDRHVIRRTAELLASDVPLRDVFSQFCRLLAHVIDASRVFIALQETHALRIVFMLVDGKVGAPDDAEIRPGSQSALVIETGRSIIKHDAADWTTPRQVKRLASLPDSRDALSAVYVPLKFGADTIGVLSVQSAAPNAYTAADVELLETCALYLAVRVHDARQESLNRALQGLVSSDGLTGVANRRTFDERLVVEWERCIAAGSSLAIVFIDVDYFKAFNDSYGHIAGDACLQQVAHALGACVKRTNDILARYGGEEFAAVLPSTSLPDAIIVAERMRAAVEALALDHDGSTLGRVSISVGVASVPAVEGHDPMAIVKLADEAAYMAKERGRNRVVAPPDYESKSPPALRRQAARHNLPLQLTRFLGRERELNDLRKLLGDARLLTLTGSGGIGKTRLALEAARGRIGTFADGVWLLDLARLEDPALVPGALAAAMELDATDQTPSLELVVTALRSKHALLIFDNCEHLSDACGRLVEALLSEAPGIHVVATSREPLGIIGERIYRVASLALPPDERPLTAEEALGYDGVQFFVTRAEESAAFVLDDANAGTVVHVARRLDGIPLAIELATARLRAMTVQQLSEKLDASFRVLSGGSRTALPRQQTLRALIEWSYQLLNERERTLFARLSVFGGTWTLDAAAHVCADDKVPPEAIDEHVAQLVDKSLVLMETHGAHNRYRFLQSTREYARERLSVDGDAVATQRRCVDFYRDLAERLGAAPDARPTRAWLPPSLPEWDNFRMVLTWTLLDGGDRVAGATIVAGLVPYWEAVSKTADALYWLNTALDAPGLPDPLIARLAIGTAFFLRLTSDEPGRATALSRRALQIAKIAGDERMRANALVSLGGASLMDVRAADASPLFSEALGIARACGDRLCESDALNNLAICKDYAGDADGARDLYEASLAIARGVGHDRRIARALHNLAGVAKDARDLDTAARYEREAIALLERYGTPRQFLIDLADLELVRGNLEAADRICRDIIAGLVLERSMWLVRECLFVFAQVHAKAGHDERAACLLGFMETLDSELAPRQPAIGDLYVHFIAEIMNRMSPQAYMRAYSNGIALTLDAAVNEARLPI